MRQIFHIIFDQHGERGTRKNRPKANVGEVVVRFDVSIPDGYFQRDIPTVTVQLPEPLQLTADDLVVTFAVTAPMAVQEVEHLVAQLEEEVGKEET